MNVVQLKSEILKTRERLNLLHEKKEQLKLDISLVVDEGNIDIDFLDEQARKKLGLRGKDEKVVYHESSLKKPLKGLPD